jgi:hypothetical protein
VPYAHEIRQEVGTLEAVNSSGASGLEWEQVYVVRDDRNNWVASIGSVYQQEHDIMPESSGKKYRHCLHMEGWLINEQVPAWTSKRTWGKWIVYGDLCSRAEYLAYWAQASK